VAEDVAGNVTTITRDVVVEDNEAPKFSNTSNEVITHDVKTKLNFPFNVSDNYYAKSSLQLKTGGSFFSNFPNGVPDSLGFFNARFTYVDGSGNQNSINVSVKVVDRIAPTITLTGSQIVTIPRWTKYQDSLGVTYDLDDNFSADSAIDVKVTGSYKTQYIQNGFPNGIYEIVYQAIDPAGNKSPKKNRGVKIVPNSGKAENEGINMDVYPNPSEGQFNFDLTLAEAQPLEVQVINAQGKVLKTVTNEQNSKGGSYQVDLTNEAKGMYQVKIQTEDEVFNKPIIIE
jgi:hypothetical protein